MRDFGNQEKAQITSRSLRNNSKSLHSRLTAKMHESSSVLQKKALSSDTTVF